MFMTHQLMVLCIGLGMVAVGIRLLGMPPRQWLGVHCAVFGGACAAISLGAEIQPWTLMLTPLPLSWLPTGRPRDQLSLAGGLTACACAATAVLSTGEARTIAIGVAAVLTVATGTREVRLTTGDLRRRVDFFTAGLVFDLACLVCLGVVHVLTGWPQNLRTPAVAAQALLPIFFAGSTSNAVLRRADRVLETTLPWTVLTVASVTTYAVAVTVATGGNPPDSAALLAGLVVVAVGPSLAGRVHTELRRRTNQFLYGNDRSPRELVHLLRRKVEDGVPDAELFWWVVTALHDTLPAQGVSIWRADGLDLHVLARSGEADHLDVAPVAVAELAHRHQRFGCLRATRHEDAPPFTHADQAILNDLAVEVARIIERSNRETLLQDSFQQLQDRAEELRRSRGRIVTAADDARRRLERDLHDGVQQDVLATAVGVQNVRTLMCSDRTQAAVEVLDQLEDGLRDTLASLRALSHGIYPPALESGGLSEALVSIAAKAAVPITVDTGSVGRLAPEVEAAIYFVCAEAIQNAIKHGGTGTCIQITAHLDHDRLRFTVSDTGTGFEPDALTEQRGLTHMADRIGALGGEMHIESTIGSGTRITGSVSAEPDRAGHPEIHPERA